MDPVKLKVAVEQLVALVNFGKKHGSALPAELKDLGTWLRAGAPCEVCKATATRAVSGTGSLADAQALLRSGLPKGLHCPCCGQFAKRYKYKFSANICRFLVYLYKRDSGTPGVFIHVKEIPKEILLSRDFLRPAFYGMIEEAANQDPNKKKRSGAWRITLKGKEFVERKSTIHEYICIYNNEVLGFEGNQVYIDHFQNEFFNYRELMDR